MSVTRFVTDIFAPLLWRVTVFTLAHHLILFGFDPCHVISAAVANLYAHAVYYRSFSDNKLFSPRAAPTADNTANFK